MKTVLFYADNKLVASTDMGWLQSAFNTLTRIFDRVGLRTSVRKTMGMVCTSCRADGLRADKTYTPQMTGEVQSFK